MGNLKSKKLAGLIYDNNFIGEPFYFHLALTLFSKSLLEEQNS